MVPLRKRMLKIYTETTHHPHVLLRVLSNWIAMPLSIGFHHCTTNTGSLLGRDVYYFDVLNEYLIILFLKMSFERTGRVNGKIATLMRLQSHRMSFGVSVKYDVMNIFMSKLQK